MNAKPVFWKCWQCDKTYPTEQEADACCQPKPEPEPLGFAALRECCSHLSTVIPHILWQPDEVGSYYAIRKYLPCLIDLAERCEAAEKERDQLKAELAALKSAPSGLTEEEEKTVLGLSDKMKFVGTFSQHEVRQLLAIIARLKSAAPTLNWRQGFPVGTWVVYAVRNSWGSIGFADGAEVVCGGIKTRNGVLRKWSDGILAIPFAELAATLPKQ